MTADSPRLRLAVLAIVALSLFAALFARLWYLQVLSAPEFQVQAAANQIRHVYEPAPRPMLYCEDESVLGAPFYVMERRRGIIVRRAAVDHPIAPETVRRLCESLIEGLARLHALTESLDHAMARAGGLSDPDDAGNYVVAWKEVGRRADRQLQLDSVIALGAELARLTRLPGLRMMLRMMRSPASAAGLGSLQRFLESGFDTFAAIAKLRGGAEAFLGTIRTREQRLIDFLFAEDPAVCEAEVRRILGDTAR